LQPEQSYESNECISVLLITLSSSFFNLSHHLLLEIVRRESNNLLIPKRRIDNFSIGLIVFIFEAISS
jgi:hypothetical protein